MVMKIRMREIMGATCSKRAWWVLGDWKMEERRKMMIRKKKGKEAGERES